VAVWFSFFDFGMMAGLFLFPRFFCYNAYMSVPFYEWVDKGLHVFAAHALSYILYCVHIGFFLCLVCVWTKGAEARAFCTVQSLRKGAFFLVFFSRF